MSPQPLAPGDWAKPGKSQSRMLQKPLFFLFLLIFSVVSTFPSPSFFISLHLLFILCCNLSSRSLSLSLFYMHLHPYLLCLCPWLSFLSFSRSRLFWIWVQSLTRTGELQLLINDYFQRWQESTAKERGNAKEREAERWRKEKAGLPPPLSLAWGIKCKSQCIIRTGWTSLTTPQLQQHRHNTNSACWKSGHFSGRLLGGNKGYWL